MSTFILRHVTCVSCGQWSNGVDIMSDANCLVLSSSISSWSGAGNLSKDTNQVGTRHHYIAFLFYDFFLFVIGASTLHSPCSLVLCFFSRYSCLLRVFLYNNPPQFWSFYLSGSTCFRLPFPSLHHENGFGVPSLPCLGTSLHAGNNEAYFRSEPFRMTGGSCINDIWMIWSSVNSNILLVVIMIV